MQRHHLPAMVHQAGVGCAIARGHVQDARLHRIDERDGRDKQTVSSDKSGDKQTVSSRVTSKQCRVTSRQCRVTSKQCRVTSKLCRVTSRQDI